jgi:pimeloyl-ACP methyl ester carboxylesterase
MTIEKGYVRTSGGQIHYRHVSGTGTPVVMFHRNPATSKCFERMMKLMVDTRPLYAFDTPGFGESFVPKGMPDILAYRDWMVEAIEALGLESVHIFAHHTGTHYATEMAVSHPELVKSLTLNGIAYFTPKTRAKIKDEYGNDIPLDVNGGYVSEVWKGIHQMFDINDTNLELLHEEFVSALASMTGRHQSLHAILDQDYRAPFAKVTCPMLAMCAKDDFLEFCFEDALEARPDAKKVILGKGRFFSPELDTSRTVDALNDFLDEVESSEPA